MLLRGGKIQKSIQDTFCSGSENEGDGVGWEEGGREERGGEEGMEGGRCGGGVVMCE